MNEKQSASKSKKIHRFSHIENDKDVPFYRYYNPQPDPIAKHEKPKKTPKIPKLRMKCITCKDKKEKTVEQETKKIEKYVVPIRRKEQKLAEERHKREEEMFYVCKKEVIRLPSPLSVATTSGQKIEFESAYKKVKVVPEKISMTDSTMKWPPEPTLQELKAKAPKSRIYINKTKREKKSDKQPPVDSVDFIYNENYRQTHPWFVMYRGPDNSLIDLKDYEEEEEYYEEQDYEALGYEVKDYEEEEDMNDYESVLPEQSKLKDDIVDEKEDLEKQREQKPESIFVTSKNIKQRTILETNPSRMDVRDEQEDTDSAKIELKEEMTEATIDHISKLSVATSLDSEYKLKYASNVDLDTGIEPTVIHKILQKYQRDSEMHLATKTKMPFKRGTLKSHSTSKLPKEPKSFYFGVKTGTLHFGDVIFSERSRYRQGLPITVCAYTFSFMKHPSKWTSRDIDKVLEKGDKLYLESLDKRHVHNESRVLQPEELSNVIIFGEKKIKYKIDEPDIAGFIKSEDPKVFNLLKGLTLYFQKNRSGILQSYDTNVLIWKQKHFYVFDPEPRTQELYTAENGIAVLATFYDIPSILVMLLDRGNLDNWPFIISKISIKKISSTVKPITDTDSISSEYTEDKLYRIINQERAVLSGSICIEDECFGESKNRLAYASSIISLVYSHITPPSAWNRTTIDKILYVSNQFYLEWQKLHPEETMDLANIPAFFTVGPITFEIAIYANQYAGLMYQKQNCLFEELLLKFFSSNTTAIVQIDKYILAIWKNRDMYYTFDPYARDTEGFRSLAGTAAVNMNINISTLVQTVIKNFSVKTYIFKINILKVVKINRDPEFEKPPRGYFNSEASLLDTLPLTNRTITIDDTECAMRTTELDEPLAASLLEIGSYVGSLDMKYVTPVPRTLSKLITKFTAPQPEKIYDLDSPSLSETQIDKAKPGPLRENSFEFRLLEEIKREEKELDKLGDLEEGTYDYVREINTLEVMEIQTIMEMKDEITQQGRDYEIFYATAQVNTNLIGIAPLPRVVLEPNKVPIKPTGRKPTQQVCIVSDEVPVTQSQELAKDSNFILLPDGSEILYGTKNVAQLGEDFDVMTPFVCIVAVIMAKKYTLNTWSKEVVDAILDYGCALQKNVDVEFQKVPKIKLPRIVIGSNAYTVTVDYMFDSLLESSILETCLEKLVFSNRESAIVVTENYACAVFLKRHLYYMYDGFGCNLVGLGLGPDNEGMACTFRFKTLHHLVSRFCYNKKQREIYEPTEAARFVISTVDVKTIWPESKEKLPRKRKLDQPESKFESNPQSIHKGETSEDKKKQKNVVGYHAKGKYVVIEGSCGIGERTEDGGQVKPCHFINLCAMIGLLNRPIKSWDTKRVDYVLDMGQTLFSYIDNTNFADKRNIQNLLLDKHFFDILVKRLDIQNPVNRKNLTVALNHLLKKNKYLLVQFPNCCFVLYDSGKNLHLFDPYGYKKDDAKAAWIKMENTKSIVKYFKKRNLKENFFFYTVNISRIEKASRKKQIEYRLRVTNVKKEKPIKKPKILHEDEDWLQVYPIPWSHMKKNLASGSVRGNVANKWFNWDVEYPDDLYSLTSTIHQTSREFSTKSRGKQTIANCIACVVMTEMYDFTEWNPAILDSIIRAGDRYFHQCFKGKREKNYEIKVEDFKTELSVFPYNVCVDILPLIEGTMFLQKPQQFNLSKALRYFFEEHENRCGIICCSNEQNKTKYLAFGRIRNGIASIAVVGLLGISSALFIFFVHPYDFLFRWKIILGEGGEIFELWRNPPVDLYLKVFLYNVTNHEEFLAGKEKLRIEEIGPYVYKESLSHGNITFNENGTLSAIPNHPLEWVPELSEGRQEDDVLILPNIALLSITHVVRDSSYFTRLGLNMVIRQTMSEPLVKMTAKEFMFGYKSQLLTLGNNFMPGWITFDKLGLIDRMYDFDGDYETVYTGETDERKSGLLDTYKGSTNLPHWQGKHCANIQGSSDGTKFPSFIEPNDKLLFYRKSLCRGSVLTRVNDTVRQDLEGYTYTFTPNAMDNGYFDPENKCFCRNGNCLPYGLLDVTDCYYGFPIALSYPHFLHSDPTLLNAIDGSEPDAEKHESYFVIQPQSGLPLDVAVRFQINMAIGDVSSMAKVSRFSNMVLPMLWMEIRLYSLPDFLAARMKLYLNVMPTVETVAMYSLLVVGALFIGLAVSRLFTMKSRWSKQNRIGTTWLDEEITCDKNRRSSKFDERRDSVKSKELEVYYNSLMTPLNEDMTFQDFLELKEEVV